MRPFTAAPSRAQSPAASVTVCTVKVRAVTFITGLENTAVSASAPPAHRMCDDRRRPDRSVPGREADGYRRVAGALVARGADREAPPHVVFRAVAGVIAEAGRQACGVGLASAQKHPVGEERPGSVADLIDGSRHLATLGVDEREGAAVHTPHRP